MLCAGVWRADAGHASRSNKTCSAFRGLDQALLLSACIKSHVPRRTAVHSFSGCLCAAAWWFQKPNTVRAEASLKLDDNNRIWGA